jgi:hypothetical protein
MTGVNINEQWANFIVGLDGTTYYAINCRTGTVISTNTVYATVYAAAVAALPAGVGVIIDKTGITGPAPKINRYASGVLSEAAVNVLSASFAIDSAVIVSVTTAHGLSITPALKDISVTIVQDTAVDDWACGYVKVVSVDATNVVCKVNVTVASATSGAKARLGIKIDVR